MNSRQARLEALPTALVFYHKPLGRAPLSTEGKEGSHKPGYQTLPNVEPLRERWKETHFHGVLAMRFPPVDRDPTALLESLA